MKKFLILFFGIIVIYDGQASNSFDELSAAQALSVYSDDNSTLENCMTHIFKVESIPEIPIEETLPPSTPNVEGFLNEISQTELEFNRVTKPKDSRADLIDVGNSFSSLSPWNLLVLKAIRQASELTEERILVGDWGCGQGFFSKHAVISGGKIYATDIFTELLRKANDNIYGAKKYLPNVKMNEVYQISQGSVVRPSKKFMQRQNFINVCFNVMHFLKPDDCDKLLQNLYDNTQTGGFVVLCCETPLGEERMKTFFEKNQSQGERYPGFGLLNKIIFELKSGGSGHILSDMVRPEDADLPFLNMRELYYGVYTKGLQPVATERIYIDGDPGSENILKTDAPYCYLRHHCLFNAFDYETLEKLIKKVGFTPINGWYADTRTGLFHWDAQIAPTDCHRTKVVVVAQKREYEEG